MAEDEAPRLGTPWSRSERHRGGGGAGSECSMGTSYASGSGYSSCSGSSYRTGYSRTTGRSSRTGRSSTAGGGRPRREIVEAIPNLDHLARKHLGRLDLSTELQVIREEEEDRHRHSLVPAPKVSAARTGPLGPPPPADKRALRLRRLAHSYSELSPVKEDQAASPNKPKKWPGLLLMEIPKDPTKMPNEHSHRRDELDQKIATIHHSLSDPALRPLSEMKAQTFNYDHASEGWGISEAQSQFFPRSNQKVKELGGGKDQGFATRPYDDLYHHREAMIRQKAMLRKIGV
ncbi:unnamed protein product [Polarella glacialis]|uniref:Uncharacterized protein n=2 Tax=Polarella glacialis TaxID=89957 RepID=A0A813LTE0_POLGL|nr:unnamed protein product [Polarella glacialis]|mmetsp:Transcript_37731/g.60833  ORF Transcript_37731/g.60833 Transcript_37731/m.60833 type:complete len:289 (-) Transcript_37731:63-929(-)